jgi:acetolactate decarboxylase
MARSDIPRRQRLGVTLSDSLFEALRGRQERTGETLDHIVQDALAQALGLDHHTLFQVSTSNALVQGVYQGCVTVETLKTHGDFGLGTFDGLDGEGLMLDGKVFQALTDGSVVEPPASATAPFWVTTTFRPDRTEQLAAVDGWDDLCAQLDAFRTSPNLFAAIRIDGVFELLQYRVACKASPGADLVTATSHQAEFSAREFRGTLLGFWSPDYSRALSIPGYHLHALSDDRRTGGHVLGVKGTDLRLQLMHVDGLVVALPETPQFLTADLTADPSAALRQAELAGTKRE